MSIDTRVKRQTAFDALEVFPVVYATPDGAIDTIDRGHMLNLYAGLVARSLRMKVRAAIQHGLEQITIANGYNVTVENTAFDGGSNSWTVLMLTSDGHEKSIAAHRGIIQPAGCRNGLRFFCSGLWKTSTIYVTTNGRRLPTVKNTSLTIGTCRAPADRPHLWAISCLWMRVCWAWKPTHRVDITRRNCR